MGVRGGGGGVVGAAECANMKREITNAHARSGHAKEDENQREGIGKTAVQV